MVEVLREPGQSGAQPRFGLTTNLSGIFGKQAVAIFSSQPNSQGYGFADITEAVAAVDTPLEVTGEYTGQARIAGYTVVFNKEEPSHCFAYCDTPSGARTVVKSADKALLAQMMESEFVGCVVTIEPDRTFTMVSGTQA
jgi:acetyl-CoA C-acetyltransferase